MNAEQLLNSAKELSPELVQHRRYLHTIPGTGFDLKETLDYISGKLTEMGVTHAPCGKAGIVATIGGKTEGKVFLLRSDVDALPVTEESGEPFASTNGKMHACGHDLHATILLGAARLLKANEDAIQGTVKLMFQPAEEIFQGADDMIAAGVLENPKVDAAMMAHVFSGLPMPTGTIAVLDGVSNAAADVFTIRIQGKGCHGSMPSTGIDPLLAGAHMLVALQEIHSRELAANDEVALTFGSFNSGIAANVIPDTATLSGTLRTFNEDLRAHVKARMEEIVAGLSKAFRVESTIEYTSGCPVMENNSELAANVSAYLREMLPSQAVISLKNMKGAGSEDFACISQKVPALMLGIPATHPEGPTFTQHHPKVRFDEAALPLGAAAYAYAAIRWLEEHK